LSVNSAPRENANVMSFFVGLTASILFPFQTGNSVADRFLGLGGALAHHLSDQGDDGMMFRQDPLLHELVYRLYRL
jgi:hypothetical protein